MSKSKSFYLRSLNKVRGKNREKDSISTIRSKAIISSCNEIITKVLKNFDIPLSYYSIGKFRDSRVCIEYEDGKWRVYEGSRGHIIHLRSFDSFYEAGCNMFRSVTTGDSKLRSMNLMLKRELRIIALALRRRYGKGTIEERLLFSEEQIIRPVRSYNMKLRARRYTISEESDESTED